MDTTSSDPATDDTWPPPHLDTGIPHSARVYDYWLGGRDNYTVDRQLGDAFLQQIPTLREMARENRNFVTRATHFLAEQGVRQFLDIGSGLPTSPNLHETARAVASDSLVVYVDNDPIVLAHSRAVLSRIQGGQKPRGDRPVTAYVDADLRRPAGILDSPELRAVLDLDQPVALMVIAVLMLLSDDGDRPGEVVAALRDGLPSGSYIALTHPTQDFDEQAMAAVTGFATSSGMTFQPRREQQVREFFGDWELVEPGLVPVMSWRPAQPPEDPHAAYYWAGVARKP
jgi:hypothetical protein